MGFPVAEALRQVVVWFQVLVALSGALVCLVYRTRSPWTWLPMAGFVLHAAVSASMAVLTFMVRHGLSYATLGPLFLLGSLLGALAWVAIVAGLAAILASVPAPRK